MKAYTDYPITELGDKSGEEAPIRQVEVIDYDLDKYCTVRIDGLVKSIKAGYLYTQEGRCGEVPNIDPYEAIVLKQEITMSKKNKNKKKTIRLKNGHAYSFKFQGRAVHGLYNEGEVGYEFEGIDRYYNLSNCTNVAKLVTES